MSEIDEIRIRIRELDDAEGHGLNVTAARTFWCERAVAWAKARLTPNASVHPLPRQAAIGCNTLLSAPEDSVVSRLADAWNEFILLESVHDDHVTEFRRAIHAAQYIVMARPVQRQFNADNASISEIDGPFRGENMRGG